MILRDFDPNDPDPRGAELVAGALETIGVDLEDGRWETLPRWTRQMLFREALFVALRSEHGLGLVNAELGRTPSGVVAWVVTVRTPGDVVASFQANLSRVSSEETGKGARIPAGCLPYRLSVLGELVVRLGAATAL